MWLLYMTFMKVSSHNSDQTPSQYEAAILYLVMRWWYFITHNSYLQIMSHHLISKWTFITGLTCRSPWKQLHLLKSVHSISDFWYIHISHTVELPQGSSLILWCSQSFVSHDWWHIEADCQLGLQAVLCWSWATRISQLPWRVSTERRREPTNDVQESADEVH